MDKPIKYKRSQVPVSPGELWCYTGQHYVPADLFRKEAHNLNPDFDCIECLRRKSFEYQQKRKADRDLFGYYTK